MLRFIVGLIKKRKPAEPVSTPAPPEPGIPMTLDGCLAYLHANISDVEKLRYAAGDLALHFEATRWMRHQWNLYHPESPLRKWFQERGIYDSFDMSNIIMRSFQRTLNGQEVNLQSQIDEILAGFTINPERAYID